MFDLETVEGVEDAKELLSKANKRSKSKIIVCSSLALSDGLTRQ